MDTVTAPTSVDPSAGAAPPGVTVVAALRAALGTAFVAGLLAIPLLSYRTVDQARGLGLVGRWPEAALAVAIVFAGRFVLEWLVWPRWTAHSHAVSAAFGELRRNLPDLSRWVGPALVAVALIVPFLPYGNPKYVLDTAVLILIYVILGWGLNVVVGLAGLLDLGYVAFYAIGAYSYVLISLHFGWSFWVCLPLAGIFAAAWGVILGFPVLRLRGDYLAIVTLAFGEIIRIVLINWDSVTEGPRGISGFPRPGFFGLEFKASGPNTFAGFFGLEYSTLHRLMFLYYIAFALVLITNVVTTRLRRLPVGRAWEAMREDEIACRSLGINTTNTKLTAFAIGALFAGLAGPIFAVKQWNVSPESFVFMESAIILAIVVLGGMGSQIGVAVAAFVIIGATEVFRDLAQYRMLIFGMAMVAIMISRPRGFVGTRKPSIFLKQRRAIAGGLLKEGHG